MDIISYALSKKIAEHAVSGVQSMSIEGQNLIINTKDSGVLTMTFPTPKDGVSVTDIDVNTNNQIVFTMSDGTEFISGKIPTVKGADGVSPIVTVTKEGKIATITCTDINGTTTAAIKDGTDSESGDTNIIESISVNGTSISVDENKNVDITVPEAYDDSSLSSRVTQNTKDISALKTADNILLSRIDNISTLTEGSTTGDAELLDIRVKADGSTATSAGNAVREQVSELKSDLSEQTQYDTLMGYIECVNGNTIDGYFLEDNGNLRAHEKAMSTEKIKVSEGDIFLLSTHYRFSTCGYVFYDKNENFVSYGLKAESGNYDDFPIVDYEIVIPEGVGYVAFSTYDYKTDFSVKKAVYSVKDTLTLLKADMEKSLNGVKIDIIGDSWSAVNDTASVKYTDLLSINNGADINVLAVSGTGYFNDGSANKQFYNQASSVRTDSNIVFVFGSFNDIAKLVSNETTIGNVTDTTTDTICGCINATINNIITQNPSAKILFATPGAWGGYNANNDGNNSNNHYALEYVEAIKEVCYRRGYEAKDMLRCMNLKPWIEAFKTAYQPDGCHPNNAGHETYLYPVIKHYLESVVE